MPVKNPLGDLIIKSIKKDKLYNFLREMEFNRLLSQAISLYGDLEINKSVEKNEKITKIDTTNYETITREDQLEKLVSTLEQKNLISVDTETSSVNPIEASLVGLSFCYGSGKAYYLPLVHK